MIYFFIFPLKKVLFTFALQSSNFSNELFADSYIDYKISEKNNLRDKSANLFWKKIMKNVLECNIIKAYQVVIKMFYLYFSLFLMRCNCLKRFLGFLFILIFVQYYFRSFFVSAFRVSGGQKLSSSFLKLLHEKECANKKSNLRNPRSTCRVCASDKINTYVSPWEEVRRQCELLDIPKKKVSLLGSTGSIGKQTLEVVSSCPGIFEIVALAANSNVKLLAEQIKNFRPEAVALRDESKVHELKELLKTMQVPYPIIYEGEQGVIEVAKHSSADTVVTGIVGCAGLKPTVAAIKNKKNIALANKETLIAAGPLIINLLKEHKNVLSPADSEHSAIFQCLQGVPQKSIKRLILTASGGAFRDKKKEDLEFVTLKDALKHPNWSMGNKITIDSATLMNKGLEVIEAHYLFDVDYSNIDVIIHPQSIIHSLVELIDTSMLAQLGLPDMRLPLLYALSYPYRLKTNYKSLDLAEAKSLDFRRPDISMFPCLELAYEAGKIGGTAPAAINAANEQAVSMFCAEKIKFVDIPKIVESVLRRHCAKRSDITLEDIIEVDHWARQKAKEFKI